MTKSAIISTPKWSQAFLLIFLLAWLGCKRETSAPLAAFSINSHVGYAGRIITFDASPSIDPDGDLYALRARWDFEADGNWDSDYSLEKQINWSFTTSGYHRVILEIIDQDGITNQAMDSIMIFGPFPDSVMTDPRDGQQYRIVKIKDLWFMAENLRFGTRIQSTSPQTDNSIVEYYVYDDDTANFRVYGGYYSQGEALNYQMHTNNHGICPPGWRVPDKADWELANINVAHYFIRDYYGAGGISGFNLQYGGYFLREPYQPPYFHGTLFYAKGLDGQYWNTYYKQDERFGIRYQGNVMIMNNIRDFEKDLSGLVFFNMTDLLSDGSTGTLVIRDWYISVRCVKNRD